MNKAKLIKRSQQVQTVSKPLPLAITHFAPPIKQQVAAIIESRSDATRKAIRQFNQLFSGGSQK